VIVHAACGVIGLCATDNFAHLRSSCSFVNTEFRRSPPCLIVFRGNSFHCIAFERVAVCLFDARRTSCQAQGTSPTILFFGPIVFNSRQTRATQIIFPASSSPPPCAFPDAGRYYATALHELTHWSSHPSRCNRQLGQRFGDDAYAAEELIAEMSAAFLCAHCRIDGELHHAGYLSSWLKVLRTDKRAIFVAATRAQQAADYLLKLAQPPDREAMGQKQGSLVLPITRRNKAVVFQ